MVQLTVQDQCVEPSVQQPGRVFRSVVVLGSPRNKCNGSGICMVMSARVPTADWPCPHLKADLFLETQDVLCIRFYRKSEHAARVGHLFGGKLFQVQDRYRLPRHVQKSLGRQEPVIVAPGSYTVVESKNFWLLKINI